jgi:hypothetical protein
MATDYISISTSPRQIWNLDTKSRERADQNIAVLDLRVLRRLGITCGSMGDLGFRIHNALNGTRTLFATRHHVLVLGWVSKSCFLGILSIQQFKMLLEQAQIDGDSSSGLSFLF